MPSSASSLIPPQAKLIAVPLDFSPISLSLSGPRAYMHPLEKRSIQEERSRDDERERERAKGQVARVFIRVRARAPASREFAAGAKQRVSCV